MKLTFIGDIMMTKEQLGLFHGKGGYNFENAFEGLEKICEKDSFVIANLETPIAGEKAKYTHERYSFNSPIEFADSIKKCGVDMVTTANNHCLDRKQSGLIQTIDNLDKVGLLHIGTHKSEEESFFIKNINGIKVGFLSFTYGTNAFSNNVYLKHNEQYMVDLLQRQELSNVIERKIWFSQRFIFRCIKKLIKLLHIIDFSVPVYEKREKSKNELRHYVNSIRKCKENGAEYIISLIHVGGQYNDKPSSYTKMICDISKKNGVNAVIANHEHVIHGVDTEMVSDNYFCIYSLGNYLSDAGVTNEPYDKMAEYSAIVTIDINKMTDGTIKSSRYLIDINCIHINENGQCVSELCRDYYKKCPKEIKSKIEKDYQILANRICNTKNKIYSISEPLEIKI